MRTFENDVAFHRFLAALPAACRHAGQAGLVAGAGVVHAAAGGDADYSIAADAGMSTVSTADGAAVAAECDPHAAPPLAAAAARNSERAVRAVVEAVVAALAGSEGKRA